MSASATSEVRPAPPLTPARRRLIDLVRRLGYGRVEHLHVRDGEPVFTPPPRVVRTVRLGRRPDRVHGDEPTLKQQHHELLRLLAEVGDGVVARVEVADGLPVLVEVEVTQA